MMNINGSRMSGVNEDKKVLFVGLVCLDIITVCKEFPVEDTDYRSKDYYWQRGGNAANSSSVLSQLGVKTEFMGTMAKDMENSFIRKDLQECGVSIDNCVEYGEEMCTPTSLVIINDSNGSRTIMHYRKNLPECPVEAFRKLNLSNYQWVHFEGRPSAENISAMMDHILEYNSHVTDDRKIKISLELEKENRFQLDPLIPKADVVFVSKVKANELGYRSKEEAANSIIKHCKRGAILFCPWGEQGAVAMSKEGYFSSSPASPPEKVIDTLGAGDTFNAAAIYSLSLHGDLEIAVTFACKLAGMKCGQKGTAWIKDCKTLQEYHRNNL